MKRHIILTLALLVVATAATAQNRVDVRMIVDSVQREFIVSVPTGAPPVGGYPLVFMFHGTSQDGEKFYNDSRWKELGETEKFISVFPTALRYCVDEDSARRVTTKWNNGDLQSHACPGQYIRDDIRFVRAMLDTITRTIPINRRMIYASGFSNGAVFVNKLAMEMSDVFAAISAVAGGLDELDSAKPEYYIPVWFMLGTRDDKWLAHTNGLAEFPFNDSTLFYIRGSLSRFLGALGLDTANVLTTTPKTRTYRFSTPAIPEPTSEFAFTLVDNMFHVYPDGTNDPFAAAPIFWEFFKRSLSPAAVPVTPEAITHVALYPNPAREFIVVDGVGPVTLTLRTLIGQSVFTTTAARGARIDLPKLTPGVYAAEIIDSRTRSVSMIVVR
jgi:polyhydroxybutyrate depolymerase